MTAPTFTGVFPHSWRAEILPNRPMILPNRHFVYPGVAEEVEKGALEVLIQPGGAGINRVPASEAPFLATCALGFHDAATPTGIWSMPHPDWLCAVSGGYAYLIDVREPEKFTFLRYRPVLDILHSSPEAEGTSSANGMLLFVGHHSILAWGRDGEAWESERLSWEGVTPDRMEGGVLHGHGWDLRTDKDIAFALDLSTGKRL